MSTQAWTVDSDGVEHRVSVATDAATGRTAIRLNDRMAARPIAPDEMEREFSVGSQTFLLRRMPDGSFDLDVAPGDPAALASAAAAASTASLSSRKQKGSARGRLIAAGMILIAAGLAWWAWDGSKYSRVPWQQWSDGGHQVTIDLPGAPVDATRELPMPDGGRHEIRSFNAAYRDHLYVVEHFDMGGPIYEHEIAQVLKDEITAAWKERGEIASVVETRISNRDAMQYVVHLPAEGKEPPLTLQGVATVHGPRMYFAWVETPQSDIDTADVNRFVRSMRLPSDDAYLRSSLPQVDRAQRASNRARMEELRTTSRLMRMEIRVIIAVTTLVVMLLAIWWVQR
jgi:hypothetical protein